MLFFSQEVNSVYRILSGILNTGNIEFTAITSHHHTDKSDVPNAEALENGETQPLSSLSVTVVACFQQNYLKLV